MTTLTVGAGSLLRGCSAWVTRRRWRRLPALLKRGPAEVTSSSELSTADVVRAATDPLAQDRAQHAAAVAERAQVALAVDALALEARHLDDPQAGARDADVDQRLDLEAGRSRCSCTARQWRQNAL